MKLTVEQRKRVDKFRVYFYKIYQEELKKNVPVNPNPRPVLCLRLG